MKWLLALFVGVFWVIGLVTNNMNVQTSWPWMAASLFAFLSGYEHGIAQGEKIGKAKMLLELSRKIQKRKDNA